MAALLRLFNQRAAPMHHVLTEKAERVSGHVRTG